MNLVCCKGRKFHEAIHGAWPCIYCHPRIFPEIPSGKKLTAVEKWRQGLNEEYMAPSVLEQWTKREMKELAERG